MAKGRTDDTPATLDRGQLRAALLDLLRLTALRESGALREARTRVDFSRNGRQPEPIPGT